MIMTNIPRRKIYENLLEYEDSILEIKILTLNKDNYEKYVNKYETCINTLIKSYKKINALIIIFLENKKYKTEQDFEDDILFYQKNEIEIYKQIFKNKNFSNEFKNNLKYLNKEFEKFEKISYDFLIKIKPKLELYNTQIAEILTIRRDKMK